MGVFAVLPSLGFAARPSLGWAVLLLALTGTGISYNFGVDRWFVAAVPDALLGQAMTVMQAGRMTVMGSAMGLAGAAAEYAPLRVVMPAAGVVGRWLRARGDRGGAADRRPAGRSGRRRTGRTRRAGRQARFGDRNLRHG